MKRILLFAVILVMMGTINASFLTDIAAAAEKPRYGGTIKEIHSKGPVNFGYPPGIRSACQSYAQSALDMLVNTNIQGEVIPSLAEEWDISPDGKTYTLKLRKGVKFHDGTEFNAQAVKWNMDMWIKTPGTVLDKLTSVDIIDDHTIRLNFSEFDNLVFFELSTEAYIVSPAAIEKHGKKWAETHPVGTGPFKFKSYERNVVIKYERNEDYWRKGLPYIDNLDHMIVKDTLTQIAALKTGEANVVRGMDFEYAEHLKKDGYNIFTYPEMHIVLFPDSKNPDSLFSNRKVREAIEYAMDRDGMSKMSNGLIPPLYQMVLPDTPLYDPSIKPRKYDPEKAKKLLAEAGYPDGIEINVSYMFKLWPESWVYLQSKMAEAGIKLNLDPIQRPKVESLKRKGGLNNGMIHLQLGMYPYPRNAFKTQLMEASHFAPDLARSTGFDDLVLKSLMTRDPEENRAIFKQINKMIHDDVMVFPLFVEPRVNAFHKSIQNYKTLNKFMTGPYYSYFMHMWIKK